MAIDKADWHYGGDFPESLPDKNGGTHIGMYLNWIIDNDLISSLHLEESNKGIAEVKARKITGREFLFDYCDEKIREDDLNEEGLKFTKYYYLNPSDPDREYGQYLEDYQELLLKVEFNSLYEIPNSWENYEKIAKRIDERYQKWKKPGSQKPWLLWKK